MTAEATHLRVVASQESGVIAKTYPHDIDAEGAVLSACMVAPGTVDQVREFLRPEHFYAERHRQIFEAILGLHASTKPVDVVTVGAALKANDRIAQVGGMQYLTEVLNAAPAVANVRAYGESIYEFWRLRRAVSILQRWAAEGSLDHGPLQPWLDSLLREIASVASLGLDGGWETSVDCIRRLLAELSRKEASPYRDRMGIPYGIPELDELTTGMHSGHLIVVSSLPGRGKSTFMVNVAEAVARAGMEVHIFALEESRDDLLLKLISKHARVNSKRLRNSGKEGLSSGEWSRILAAAVELEPIVANIRIDDAGDLHIGQIRQRALAHRDRTMAQFKRPVGLVAIDYLQKAKPAPEVARLTPRERIIHTTDGLKALAKHMKIPVMALAQQKPSEIDKFTKLRPLPDTNSIEGSAHPGREADRLLFLHREPLRKAGKIVGEDPAMIRIIVPKSRGGETGEVLTRFEREYSTFTSVSAEDGPPAEPTRYFDQFRGVPDPEEYSRAGPDK